MIARIARSFPKLETELRKAHMRYRPEEHVSRTLKNSLVFSAGLSVFVFFMLDMLDKPIVFALLAFPLLFLLFFMLLLKSPVTKINKRKRDLDREVLFAGRFLLVKLHSGRPLLNALIDASHSYGVASKYFKELVDDINMGTSIERALENAMRYSPSARYSKILFQVSNALKIGIDVTESLDNTLDEISQEQLLEIERYGKKLNSLSIFYMLLAVVMPSIGVAMFAVIGSLIGLSEIAQKLFLVILLLLAIMQIIFVSIFKNARLTVNI